MVITENTEDAAKILADFGDKRDDNNSSRHGLRIWPLDHLKFRDMTGKIKEAQQKLGAGKYKHISTS